MRLSDRVGSNLVRGFALIVFAAMPAACAGTYEDPAWVVRPTEKFTLAPGYEALRVEMGNARIVETASRKRAGSVRCDCAPPSTECCFVDLPSPIDPDKLVACEPGLCGEGVPCNMLLTQPSLLDRFLNLFLW